MAKCPTLANPRRTSSQRLAARPLDLSCASNVCTGPIAAYPSTSPSTVEYLPAKRPLWSWEERAPLACAE